MVFGKRTLLTLLAIVTMAITVLPLSGCNGGNAAGVTAGSMEGALPLMPDFGLNNG